MSDRKQFGLAVVVTVAAAGTLQTIQATWLNMLLGATFGVALAVWDSRRTHVDAAVKRHQKRELKTRPVFVPVEWAPQVEVTFTRDVNGWVDEEARLKWAFKAGQTVFVDEKHAVEFIVKGYATGELPRKVSDDEAAEIRSVMTTIGLGGDTRA